MKILIADDHAIVREGLKQIVSDSFTFAKVDEAENGFDVIEKCNSTDYDVVIIDISMPGKNGLDTLKELRIDKPKLPILILSVHDEEQYGIRALKAGASGFIPKHSDPETFKDAITKVTNGKRYLSEKLVEKLAANLDDLGNLPLHEKLSDREFQVFQFIADGKTIKDISEELHLSNKTISTYRARILEKLDLKNYSEIIRYAIEHKISE